MTIQYYYSKAQDLSCEKIKWFSTPLEGLVNMLVSILKTWIRVTKVFFKTNKIYRLDNRKVIEYVTPKEKKYTRLFNGSNH